jgi:hypothetical protein
MAAMVVLRSLLLVFGLFLAVAAGSRAYAVAETDHCSQNVSGAEVTISDLSPADQDGSTADDCEKGKCSGALTCHCFCHAHISSLPALDLALPTVAPAVRRFSHSPYLAALSPTPPARPPKAQI